MENSGIKKSSVLATAGATKGVLKVHIWTFANGSAISHRIVSDRASKIKISLSSLFSFLNSGISLGFLAPSSINVRRWVADRSVSRLGEIERSTKSYHSMIKNAFLKKPSLRFADQTFLASLTITDNPPGCIFLQDPIQLQIIQ